MRRIRSALLADPAAQPATAHQPPPQAGGWGRSISFKSYQFIGLRRGRHPGTDDVAHGSVLTISCTMTMPRSFVVPEDTAGHYHLISRCVRRAFLCGDQAAHRQAWLAGIIREAAEAFAVEVLAYAVMSNHLHIVVHMTPSAARTWTAADVSARWHMAHPQLTDEGFQPWPAEHIEARAKDQTWCETAQERLKSLSWFMKCIKERLARVANREDKCTGHFWEGRFQSVPLLDAPAVVACMAYVDLNPIRAAICEKPEDSPHTSVRDRCEARQRYHKAVKSLETLPLGPDEKVQAEAIKAKGSQAGMWIAKLPESRENCTAFERDEALEAFPLTRDEYLDLVDQTGRMVRDDKRGAIPPHLQKILERLDLDVNRWLTLMAGGGSLSWGSGIGKLAARAAEAVRRKGKWIIDTCAGLYRLDPAPDPAPPPATA